MHSRDRPAGERRDTDRYPQERGGVRVSGQARRHHYGAADAISAVGRVYDVAGAAAFVTRIRAVILRDTGATISPFNAWILLQGLETLSLRVERHVQNALKVVEYLANNPKVTKVNHPSLPSHPDHELYKKLYPNGAGSIFTFEIKGGQKEAWAFIDHLRIFSLLANVADVKSLVIHPATTTHSQMSPEELEQEHIYPSTIRLSIGIENIDDLLDALKEAFEYV